MSILITNVQHYIDRPSGSSRLAYDEALYLAGAGHRIFVLAPAPPEDKPEREQFGDVCLLRYRPREFGVADPRRALAHQRAAREILLRHVKADIGVVHGHAPLSYLAVCDVFGGQAKTFYSIHSPAREEMEITWQGQTMAKKFRSWLGLPLLNRMERRCLELSDGVTAFSDFTKQEMRRLHGDGIAERIQVVPGWVDLDRFRIIQDRAAAKRSLGWPDDVPVLFTLRRLVPRMGLDRLIRAVRLLRDRGRKLFLVIGGAGPLEAELKELTANLGLDETIRFAGRVLDSELPKMYGACDAFVLPTAALECFGLIALEALACGRPVLATPVGAIPEVLSRFEEQWLAESNDESAIAKLICEFLEGKLRNHSPEALREKVRRHYSKTERLAQLAEVVLGSKRSEGAGTLVLQDQQR